ncbi:hypothetical protein [Paraburkholderia sp. 40]|uniref:hypothetical protein n=1 Tax=unclassified Paraburkholderia TaxID=2615204 RepID=UPI003D1FC9F8
MAVESKKQKAQLVKVLGIPRMRCVHVNPNGLSMNFLRGTHSQRIAEAVEAVDAKKSTI